MSDDNRVSDPTSLYYQPPDQRGFSRRHASLSGRRVPLDGIIRPARSAAPQPASAGVRPAHKRLSHAKTIDSQFHRPASSRYARRSTDICTATTLHASPQAIARPKQTVVVPEPEQQQVSDRITRRADSAEPLPEQKNKMSILLSVAAAAVFVVGIGVSIWGFRANSDVKAQAQQLQAQARNGDDAGDTPDETPPGDISGHRVAPDQPRFLTIEKLSVKARVKSLAVKSNNELKAPANIYDIGWYTGSSKPGQGGAVLLDGHVHGPSKPGVFSNLKKLGPGDMLQLERGDGKLFRYKVVKAESFPASNMDMAQALVSVEPGKNGLNLITCDGKYTKTGDYERRLLVSAVLVE